MARLQPSLIQVSLVSILINLTISSSVSGAIVYVGTGNTLFSFNPSTGNETLLS